MKNIKDEAKMKTIEEVAEQSKKDGEDNPMAAVAMSMMSIAAISMYEKHLDELGGNINDLIGALEKGNFTDENGTSMTDTLTFQNLKKRLTSES